MTVSVIIPVFNGEQYLSEVLDTVNRQQLDEDVEVLVIDSGSHDRSVEIARAAGAHVIEIPNEEFQHGRTRNFGMEKTSGRLVAFLTQDATPAGEHWLAAYVEAFELDDRVGAAYGPHLPRPDVNPLMARLLTEFFAGFSPDGGPVVHRRGDIAFLSNSNSCIARAAWEQIPFREIPYAEDQALGADLLAAGWSKVYMPAAGAYHSHDYGMIEGFKRYFDEYRGLHDSVGHVEPASPKRALRTIGGSVTADARWLFRDERRGKTSAAWWTGKSVVHHSGRVLFGGLGGRANSLPPRVRAALSYEGRSDAVDTRVVRPFLDQTPHWDILRYHSKGAAPLREPSPADATREQLHIAWVVPPFDVGGGGHTTIFRMVQALERQGHTCTIWVHDPHSLEHASGAGMRKRIADHYLDVAAHVELGFDNWRGADVAIATGWETVYPVMLLGECAGRAYFVQDHEPEFYATSSDSSFAEHTYSMGLKCICASPWLADLVATRYGADTVAFELGVDTGQYHPEPGVERSDDLIVYYARNFTARRAVELGTLALAEVVRRRPGTRVALFGTHHTLALPFEYRHVGVVDAARLRRLYGEATVGLSTSLTNYSLIPTEMLACGLPVVELRGRACESVFGDDDEIVTLADEDPVSLADAICELLDDPERRARLSRAGLEFASEATWDAAFEVVEATLLAVFRERAAHAVTPAPAAAVDRRPGSLI